MSSVKIANLDTTEMRLAQLFPCSFDQVDVWRREELVDDGSEQILSPSWEFPPAVGMAELANLTDAVIRGLHVARICGYKLVKMAWATVGVSFV